MSLQSKYLAGISLAVMGAGFIGTIPAEGSLIGRIAQSGFEAGLVGGLADWFAVTALFRRPFGLPIPHTALLPKNRKTIISKLISLIENDWLTKESIINKLSGISLTEKAIGITEKQLYTSTVKKALQSFLITVVKKISPEKIAPLIEKELKSYAADFDLKPAVEFLANTIIGNKADEKVLDYTLHSVAKWTEKESSKYQMGHVIMTALQNKEWEGFMKIAVKSVLSMLDEEKIGRVVQEFALNEIYNILQKEHPNRVKILAAIRANLIKISSNEDVLDKLEIWKKSAVSGISAEGPITDLLAGIQDKLLAFAEKTETIETYVLPVIQNGINSLKNNPETMNKIELWVQKQIVAAIEANHNKIGKLVKENLDKLDDKTLIDMIENNVGKDLQWIRVNGAICGFIIGLLLAGFKLIF
ncbi:DUF445 domain-containing protein [Peribacillus sp. B-H-3]|uniref:DUF445 domain-containing protein n=1 Tax=Peribacillus sp. B-H-3 TaxID=3400420 RepID=UPI003B016A10